MVDTTITYKLEIDDSNSVQTLGQLKTSLDANKKAIENLAVGSQEFKKLSDEIRKADGQVKNLEKSFEGMDTEALAGSIAQFGGGVTEAFGGLILLGGEGNQTLVEMQANLNKAIGVTMAVKGAMEGFTAGLKLAKQAQLAMNVAVLSNPYVLAAAAVVALGAAIYVLVTNYDDAEEKIVDATKALDEFNKRVLVQNKGIEDQAAKMKAQGKDEATILKYRQVRYQELAADMQVQMDTHSEYLRSGKITNEELMDVEIKYAAELQRTKAGYEAMAKSVSTEMENLTIKTQQKTAVTKEDTNATNDNTDALAEQAKAEKFLSDTLTTLNDKRTKDLDTIDAAEKAYTDSFKSNKQVEIETANKTYTDLIALAEANGAETETLKLAHAKAVQGINDNYNQIEIDKAKQLSDTILSIKQNQKQAELSLLSGTIGFVGDLIRAGYDKQIEDAEGNQGKIKEIKKKEALANVVLGIADIGINLAKSLSAISAYAFGLGPIAGPIYAAGAVPLAWASSALNTGMLIAQQATVASMAKGGMIGGQPHSLGGTMINAELGESVINKKSTKVFAPVLSAINQAGGGNPIGGNGADIINYEKLASMLNAQQVYVTDRDVTDRQGRTARITNRSRY